MRLERRVFLKSMLCSMAAPAILRSARADAPQVTLKLHHFFSSISSGHEKFLAPWVRRIETQSGGRIRIDIFPSMQLGGSPAQLFDQVRDGFVDIAWTVPGYTPGRFGRVEAFELPFVPSRRALVNSKALEDFATVNLRDEFREVHPICFSCRDHGVVHTNRPVHTVADLRGLRLHVPNRLAEESLRVLGAQGVSVPVPQVPMAVSGHAIEGGLLPWDAVPALRLTDLLKQHTDFADSAISTSTLVLAMNKATYERLPRDLKKVVDDNSGLDAAGMAGAMWDLEAKMVADMVRERGDTITLVPVDEVVNWRRATEPVVALWIRQMKERKVDGRKLVASVHELLGKYASEPEPASPVQGSQTSTPTTAGEPPKPPPQRAADGFIRPKADAPTPIVKRAPKELDIPL